jgi:hypothetical protein
MGKGWNAPPGRSVEGDCPMSRNEVAARSDVIMHQGLVAAATGHRRSAAFGPTLQDLLAELFIVLGNWLAIRAHRKPEAGGAPEATTAERPRVFVSHSHADAQVVGYVVDLLRSALNLHPQHIRCTGVEGHQLRVGEQFDDELLAEVREAQVLIAVVSVNSLSSQYAMFEIAVRWGTSRPLLPVLMPGVEADALKPPLSRLSAAHCGSVAQLQQLVSDVGEHLGVQPNAPATFYRQIEGLRTVSNRASTA